MKQVIAQIEKRYEELSKKGLAPAIIRGTLRREFGSENTDKVLSTNAKYLSSIGAMDSSLKPIPVNSVDDQVLGHGAVGDRKAKDSEEKVVRAKTGNQLASAKLVIAKCGGKILKTEKVPAGGWEITYTESDNAEDGLEPIPVNDDTKYAVPPKKSSWSGTSAALKTPSEVTEAYGKKDPAGFKKSFGKDREPTPAEEEAWENGYEDGKEDDPQKAPGNFNLRNAYRQGYLAGTKKRGAKDEDLKPIPVKDSFNDLVGKLERGGKSKEYATKIAGKVAAEKKAVKDSDLVPEDCEANIYYYKEQIKMAERQRAKRGDEETNADLHFYKEQLAMEERNLAKVKRGEKVVARDGKAKDADNTKARLDKLKAEYAKKPSAELKGQIERLTDYLKQLAKAQPDKYPFSEDAAPANDCCYFVTT